MTSTTVRPSLPFDHTGVIEEVMVILSAILEGKHVVDEDSMRALADDEWRAMYDAFDGIEPEQRDTLDKWIEATVRLAVNGPYTEAEE